MLSDSKPTVGIGALRMLPIGSTGIGAISAPSKLYMGAKAFREHPLVIIRVLHTGPALGCPHHLRAFGSHKPSLLSLFGSSVEEAPDPFVLGIVRVENRMTNAELCGSLPQHADVGNPDDVRSSTPLRRRWSKPPMSFVVSSSLRSLLHLPLGAGNWLCPEDLRIRGKKLGG